MSLIGTLSDVKIADVLRLFAEGRKTGLLTVAARGHETLIRFQKGAIVHAAAGRLQGDDAVLDLFGWKDGQISFVPEHRNVVANVTHGVDVLVLEGTRVGETFHRMNEVIPSDRVVFQLGPGPADDSVRYSVGSVEWRVIQHLDGVRDLRQVMEASQLPRAEVVRTIFEMTEAGFLERVDSQRALRAQAQRRFGSETAEMDERMEEDWKRINRFAHGVLRVEVRSQAGKEHGAHRWFSPRPPARHSAPQEHAFGAGRS